MSVATATAAPAALALARAADSVSATVVVRDPDYFAAPWGAPRQLAEVYRRANRAAGEAVTKIALVRESRNPLFDLDYSFIQAVPGPQPDFEFHGNCGHSILAAARAAVGWGWSGCRRGQRTAVRVLPANETVVVEHTGGEGAATTYRAHFIQKHGPVEGFLVTGEPTTELPSCRGLRVSLVDCSNPYVFVDAKALGFPSPAHLFRAGQDLFRRLEAVRRAAAALAGYPGGSVFPKVCALGLDRTGGLFARAISVPKWHPTLALTGLICLAAAAHIPGTVAAELLAGRPADTLTVRTPGARVHAQSLTDRHGGRTFLESVSVPDKLVHWLGPVPADSALT